MKLGKFIVDANKIFQSTNSKIKIVKTATLAGMRIIQIISPETGEKIDFSLEKFQYELDKYEGSVDKFVSDLENRMDRAFGNKIENTMDSVERKIQEKGGAKLEKFVSGSLEEKEKIITPIAQNAIKKIKPAIQSLKDKSNQEIIPKMKMLKDKSDMKFKPAIKSLKDKTNRKLIPKMKFLKVKADEKIKSLKEKVDKKIKPNTKNLKN